MVKVRADESRYVVSAEGRAAALVRRIPGCRFNASLGQLQLPRQPGAILAMDELFGPDGWEHPADLAIEVAETRGREPGAAEQDATVELAGNELAIACAFADKELVKLVPGYRWSAPQRRWYVPASPMALAILEKRFGDRLDVGAGIRDYLDLKARDEEALAAREATREVTARVVAAAEPAPEPGPAPAGPVSGTGLDADTTQELFSRLDRLATAVEALVESLRDGRQLIPAGAMEAPGHSLETPLDSTDSWRELFLQASTSPEEALPIIQARLQTAAPGDVRSLLAVAGFAAELTGDDDAALRQLRRSLAEGTPGDEELEAAALKSYGRAALGLLETACGPKGPLNQSQDLLALLRADIHQAGLGFDGEALASKEALGRLEYLVNDPVLLRADHALSDCCRVAHLLAVSRGNSWMGAERVEDLLRDREIGADGFALGVGILADALFEAESMEEWRYRWPAPERAESMKDLRWLVETCITRLPGAEGASAALAALACLACIANGPEEWANRDERRTLLRYLGLGTRERRYGEFLAAFSLAAAGHGRIVRDFPGYTTYLAEVRLETSAPHLLDVFMMQSGNAGGLTHHLAEEVIPAALQRGVGNPNVLLELLDLVAESPKGDSLLNQVAAQVEDDGFIGAASLSHGQRLTLYRRALAEAQARGHDNDGLEAFDRLVRELLAHDEIEELRTSCHDLGNSFRAIRHATLEVALELALEAGEPFEELAGNLIALASRSDADIVRREIDGLALAYPAMARYLEAQDDSPAPMSTEPDLAGRRVVIVGGHQWLKKNALPILEDQWKLDVAWLDPDEAKNSAQALGLAGGTSDLIVVNTACIGHAGSRRVTEEAKSSGKNYVFQGSRGVGALLSCVRGAFDGEQGSEAAPRRSRAADRRRLVR